MDLLTLVQPFDTICLFRHTSADADAMGSQFALKTFYQAHFPDKKVYALGDDVGSCARMFDRIDHVQDDAIKGSIAIVLDCANAQRIDDQRYLLADTIVKIDHHIVVDTYEDISYVNTSASATCEIVATLIQQGGYTMPLACAKYLYLGLLADSAGFTTNNTTADSLACAAYLVSQGLDVNAIHQERMYKTYAQFSLQKEIYARSILDGKVLYSVIDTEVYEALGLSYNEAKENVFVMSNIQEVEMWCLFTQDNTSSEGLYNGSLRSKKYAIDTVANAFQGGGHKHACGVKQLDKKGILSLVEMLNALIK